MQIFHQNLQNIFPLANPVWGEQPWDVADIDWRIWEVFFHTLHCGLVQFCAGLLFFFGRSKLEEPPRQCLTQWFTLCRRGSLTVFLVPRLSLHQTAPLICVMSKLSCRILVFCRRNRLRNEIYLPRRVCVCDANGLSPDVPWYFNTRLSSSYT